MDLPIRTFWALNSNAGRLMAETDLRQMTVQMGRHGGEAGTDIRTHLQMELGNVGKASQESQIEAVRDQAGFDELKALTALM